MCLDFSTRRFCMLFLQGVTGGGFTTHTAQEKKVEDSQVKLRHAQSTLERWQQSLDDLIPSTSGRLDADTVRSVPAHIVHSCLALAWYIKLLLCCRIYGKYAIMNRRL